MIDNVTCYVGLVLRVVGHDQTSWRVTDNVIIYLYQHSALRFRLTGEGHKVALILVQPVVIMPRRFRIVLQFS